MNKFEQNLEQPKSSSLIETSAIEESRNKMILDKRQIKDLVEQPLLEACEEMYDKNIRTLSTSANKNDIKTGEAYIIIDFDSLSEENKKVAGQYSEPINYDGGKAIKIIIPVTEKTTTEEITQEAKRIASTFQKQPATWIPTYSLEYIHRIARRRGYKNISDDPEYWVQETGYFYDPESKKFYLSREHYLKDNEKIEIE